MKRASFGESSLLKTEVFKPGFRLTPEPVAFMLIENLGWKVEISKMVKPEQNWHY